ncbi:MAG: tetratricopeptide repeat protein, partial [Candidatus Promineifilaceae bacterium]
CRLITNVGLIGRLVQAYEIAIEAHQEGLSIGKALNNEFEIAQSLYNLSVLYELQGELDKSLQYTSNALVLCEDLNHSEGLAACSNQLGNVNYRQGNFEVAARYFKQAKYYCDQEGMISEAARALNNLALVYRNTQHLELALEMLDQADVILKHQPNEQILAQVVLSRTIVFLAMGDTQMAKDILERFSEARLEQLGDRILYALHLNHQGEVALNQGKTEYAVSKLEQSQEVWYDIGGAIEQSVTLINLIRAYMKQDQLEKARKCYAEAVLFFNDRKQYALVRSIYPDLMELRLQIYKISEGILQHPYEC